MLATPVKLSVVTALWIVSCKNINSKDYDMSNVLQIVYKFSFIVFSVIDILSCIDFRGHKNVMWAFF